MTNLLFSRMNSQTCRNTVADNAVPCAKLLKRQRLSTPEIGVNVHWGGASVSGAVVVATDAPTKAMIRTNAAGPSLTSSLGHVCARLPSEQQRQASLGDARSSDYCDSYLSVATGERSIGVLF